MTKKKTKKPATTTKKKTTKPAAKPKLTIRAAAAPAPTPATAAGSAPRVRVRMYRQGLGDCFLLTFHDGDAARRRHILIDCGTLGATTTGVAMNDVVDNIRDTTGGKLDLLITTHEHLDHVSGFRDQRKTFAKQFQVARVWQAWTENPKDERAKEVAKHKQDLGQALAGILAAPGAAETVPEVADLLAFFGVDHRLGAGDFAKTVNAAMEFVRTGLGAKTEYLKPGPPAIEPDWLPGFRFYVLGPPRDEQSLADTGDHDSEELYHLDGLSAAGQAVASSRGRAFGAAVGAGDPQTIQADDDDQMPFDRRFRRPAQQAAAWFPEYFEQEHAWRSIDHAYLRVASELALQLDSITNNTSLALAIERIADGKVLLFPADAQQGSWLSWHELTWRIGDGQGTIGRKVTVDDLLARTVFYKVGHHGSHNATAKGKGLEKMTRRDELTAFIPVDRKVALDRNPKGSWKMPAVALYRRLLEQCNGRVLRSDIGWAAKPAGQTEQAFEGLATDAEWTGWKNAQDSAGNVPIQENLFFDYLLE